MSTNTKKLSNVIHYDLNSKAKAEELIKQIALESDNYNFYFLRPSSNGDGTLVVSTCELKGNNFKMQHFRNNEFDIYKNFDKSVLAKIHKIYGENSKFVFLNVATTNYLKSVNKVNFLNNKLTLLTAKIKKHEKNIAKIATSLEVIQNALEKPNQNLNANIMQVINNHKDKVNKLKEEYNVVDKQRESAQIESNTYKKALFELDRKEVPKGELRNEWENFNFRSSSLGFFSGEQNQTDYSAFSSQPDINTLPWK